MSRAEIITRTKTTLSKIIIFSTPKLGTSIIMGFADFALFTLYALAYQVTPILVGLALGLGKLTIAASQFFFGWISDSKYTRFGRRKPYLIIMSPILGFSFILLLLPSLIIDLNDLQGLFVWLLLWYQIFNICYGVTSPYGSWMAEQFTVEDRPRAAQYQSGFSFVGNAIMILFSMVVLTAFIERIQEAPDIIPPEFLFNVIIFGTIPVVFFYLASFLMPTEYNFKIESSVFQNLKTILTHKNFLLVTVMQGIASIAIVMIGNTMLQYIILVLQLKDEEYYIVAALMIFGILGFLYIWRRIIEKIGKKRSLLCMFLALILFLPLTLLGLIPMDSYFALGIIFILGLAGCLGGWYLFPAIMYADIAEDDEKKTGELKAGIYQGFPSITLNIFQAIGLFLLGIILDLPVIGNLPYSIGFILWGPICSAVLIVAYFYSRKFIQLDFKWEKNLNEVSR
ncbi:MAG: MFS transporter [Candidatus Hodarchaeota archaeon]